MAKHQHPKQYHHGDLKVALIINATQIVKDQGIEQLSLRKLAEQIGVSRTAAYHHFNNKHDLLCAIAAQGFIELNTLTNTVLSCTKITAEQQFERFAHSYLTFATENPAIYHLMFGNTLWQQGQPTASLRNIALPSFGQQVNIIKTWQAANLFQQHEEPVRLAQVLWGTLHGIAQLINDGVYHDSKNITALINSIVTLFISKTPQISSK